MNRLSPVQLLLSAAHTVPRARILVAVSGGPDSVALLRALQAAGHAVAVGHVNHMLRGEDADADEQFVGTLAENLNVPFFLARVDTGAEAARSRQSLETAARTLRYDALEDMRKKWRGDVIATGHTDDDQAETVLFRLIRGSGARGLSAMSSQHDGVIRPFLGVTRKTVLAALGEWEQTYRVDASNAGREHARNRIRHDLMPILRQFNPRIVDVLSRTAALLGRDADYIESEAERACGLLVRRSGAGEVTIARAPWASLHPALAASLARQLIRLVTGDVDDIDERHITAMVRAVVGEGEQTVELPRGLRLAVDESRAVLQVGPGVPAPGVSEARVPVPGIAETNAGTLSACLLEHVDAADLGRLLAVIGPLHALCDADAVGTEVRLRSRCPGDRVEPLGAPGSRKLQDVFVDAHVPREKRDAVPVVENGSHIVWVPGHVVDRRVALSAATTRILHLTWRPKGSK